MLAVAIALAAVSLSLVGLSAYAIVATRRAGRVDVLEERLTVTQENLAHAVTAAENQRARADELDAMLADYLAATPVAGAYQLLQARWGLARSKAAAPVPDGGAPSEPTAPAGRDELIDPFAGDA
jgi:hypothetical protein